MTLDGTNFPAPGIPGKSIEGEESSSKKTGKLGGSSISMNTGIEWGAEILREFNRGEITSKTDFVTKLDKALDQVREKTIEKGRRFVKLIDPSGRGPAKFLILKNK